MIGPCESWFQGSWSASRTDQRGHMMSAVKAEAIRLIESLPEHCSLEDIQYHLYIVQKIRRGLADVDEGRFVPQEEAERRIAEWGKFTGQNPRSTT